MRDDEREQRDDELERQDRAQERQDRLTEQAGSFLPKCAVLACRYPAPLGAYCALHTAREHEARVGGDR